MMSGIWTTGAIVIGYSVLNSNIKVNLSFNHRLFYSVIHFQLVLFLV